MSRSGIDSMEAAVQLHREGRLEEAESVYRRVLLAEPTNPDALHLLGVIAYQRKQFDEAAAFIDRAIAFAGGVPEYHNSLGNVYLARHLAGKAAVCYRKALKLNPGYAEAHNNLGNVLREQGELTAAIASYQRSLRLDPACAEVQNNLGMALAGQGRHIEAVAYYREAIRLKQGYCDALSSLGESLRILGRTEDAIALCSKALSINREHSGALFNMGSILVEAGRLEEGAACYREVLRLEPDSCAAHLNLAHAMREAGRKEDAAIHFRRALVLGRDRLDVRFGNCIGQIPLVHDSAEEITVARNNYRRELESLQGIGLDNPRIVREASRLVGNCQPFFLAYQGENDRDLQSLYGSFIARVQSACFSAWSKTLPMPPHEPGEPLRIGFVSGFYHQHSNWKIPIKGWVENLDRKKFQLFGYYTGHRQDAETADARSSFFRFAGGLGSVEEWCALICSDRLHVLIFPEIGMDPMTVRLASLRLAPIQCSSWGHPDTSGLPTVDYFLSSDLMEPEDGGSHYTERLIRLPNLSVHYKPLPIEAPQLNRAHFGLRDDAVVYLCAQSLFKYLPQFDDVFPRIAREVDSCQFVFLSYVKSPYLGERFTRRLEQAFSRYGLRCEDYVKLLPHLDPPRYQALNGLADVFLDSIGWSGCNTTLEALSHDLPVLTLPGTMMRGRHSYAFLTMMGLEGTIAKDLDEYVTIAGRLGTDRDWRQGTAREVARCKDRLYRDEACIAGLEQFLENAVNSFRPSD